MKKILLSFPLKRKAFYKNMLRSSNDAQLQSGFSVRYLFLSGGLYEVFEEKQTHKIHVLT